MPIVGEFFETFLSEYAGDGQHWLDIKGFIEVLIKKKGPIWSTITISNPRVNVYAVFGSTCK